MNHNFITPLKSQIISQEYSPLNSWVKRYLQGLENVLAPNTLAAKLRDLDLWVSFYQQFNGHDDGSQWLPRDSGAFLRTLEQARRPDATALYRPRSINRILASLRTFARWVHEESGTPFKNGLPTRGIQDLVIEELGFRGLADIDMNRFLKAADRQVYTRVNGDGTASKMARPWRDRAIVYALRGTGLRESELIMLNQSQYQDKYLIDVKCKGRKWRRVFVPKEAREALDDYLARERIVDDLNLKKIPLFLLPASHRNAQAADGRISRTLVYRVVQRIANEANRHLEPEQQLKVSPHTLRHTKGYGIIQAGGHLGDVADGLGHTSIKYAAFYARRPQEDMEALLERS